MTLQDSIERDITIDAPLEKVWTLVSEPGWWINAGEVTSHEINRDEDPVVVVTDPSCGRFSLEIVESRRPDYVAFRWLAGEMDPGGSLRTLIEFFLDGDESSTTVRVKESGFLDGDAPEEERREAYEVNAPGWESGLAAAKRHLEPAGGADQA